MKIDKNNYEAFFLDYYEGRLTSARVKELMLFLEQHPELKEDFESFENVSLNEFEETLPFKNKELLKKSLVTQNNFDEAAFAFVEGTLTKELERSLFAFVKKNPAYKVQLDRYKKTILPENDKIVFENKNLLRKDTETANSSGWEFAGLENFSETELLFISSLEGTLNPSQQKQLELLVLQSPLRKKEFEQFQKAKLVSDRSTVFPGKNSLKRKVKEHRIAALYYYFAAAASLTLLLGLYLFFEGNNSKGSEVSFAKNKPGRELRSMPQDSLQRQNPFAMTNDTNNVKGDHVVLVRNNHLRQNNDQETFPLKNNKDSGIIANNHPLVRDTAVHSTVMVKNDTVNNIMLVNNFNDADDDLPVKKKKDDYLSLREAVSLKVKNALLKEEMEDATSYREDKKSFTWYDAALVIVKGVRNITGRDLAVRKRYNSKNELVAYEFSAGKYTYSRPVTKKL